MISFKNLKNKNHYPQQLLINATFIKRKITKEQSHFLNKYHFSCIMIYSFPEIFSKLQISVVVVLGADHLIASL